MVRLNGVDFAYRNGMSIKELVDDYNMSRPKLGLEGFAVLLNGAALTTFQAENMLLRENDSVLIIPMIDGG